jgi:hypothetical protein
MVVQDGHPLISNVPTFRVSCTVANGCTIVLTSSDTADLPAINQWYQQAVQGIATARRTVTLRVVDAGSNPLSSYVAELATPSALLLDADHWQLTLTSERVLPVQG